MNTHILNVINNTENELIRFKIMDNGILYYKPYNRYLYNINIYIIDNHNILVKNNDIEIILSLNYIYEELKNTNYMLNRRSQYLNIIMLIIIIVTILLIILKLNPIINIIISSIYIFFISCLTLYDKIYNNYNQKIFNSIRLIDSMFYYNLL